MQKSVSNFSKSATYKSHPLTLYRARMSSTVFVCRARLPDPDVLLFLFCCVTSPTFFRLPIDPLITSGLSTSGPPNSCSCCRKQQSIASMPSSTRRESTGKTKSVGDKTTLFGPLDKRCFSRYFLQNYAMEKEQVVTLLRINYCCDLLIFD